MKDKYPHVYVWMTSEADEGYLKKFKSDIRREQNELISIWGKRYELGGNKEIHQIENDETEVSTPL